MLLIVITGLKKSRHILESKFRMESSQQNTLYAFFSNNKFSIVKLKQLVTSSKFKYLKSNFNYTAILYSVLGNLVNESVILLKEFSILNRSSVNSLQVFLYY